MNEQLVAKNEGVNINLPPLQSTVMEPYGDHTFISSEEYLVLINRLNEFADNTFTFGESILKKMEESGINDRLKNTADKIANKGAEFGNNLFQKTRDSISSINHITKVGSLKDNARDKISSFGGRLWGVNILFLFYIDILFRCLAEVVTQKIKVRL